MKNHNKSHDRRPYGLHYILRIALTTFLGLLFFAWLYGANNTYSNVQKSFYQFYARVKPGYVIVDNAWEGLSKKREVNFFSQDGRFLALAGYCFDLKKGIPHDIEKDVFSERYPHNLVEERHLRKIKSVGSGAPQADMCFRPMPTIS